MSQPYQGRHRHASSHGRKASRSSGLTKAIRRPAVTSSMLLAVIATTAAGYQAADQRQTGAAAFTVSTEAIAQANELADAQIEDTARLAADRNDTNASMAAAQEKDRVAAVAAGEAAAKARREAAQKVAREKARKALAAKKQAILANAQADPRAAAQALLPEFGFGDGQWSCLDNLWMGESGWRYTAENSSSGAYGIPQSLPGSKMATVASDWRTNPVTQIRWGLQYIRSSYGTPCGAWSAWQSRSPHWY
ncbi:aggregation-promoting factor C-terminal-like domain-containing protein [Pedococcus sp. P5_B7]